MSAFQIFTQPSQQALDTAANVLSGATLTFTLTGTSTPTNAYSDSTLSTPVANPLSANAAGVFIPVFLDPTITYRIVLKTQAGAVLQTWDPANENLLAYFTQSVIGLILYPRTAAEISAGVTPVNYAYAPGDVRRYGADPTGVADSSAAWSAAITSNRYIFDGHPDGGLYLFNSEVTISTYPKRIVGIASDAGGIFGTRIVLASAAGSNVAAFNVADNKPGICFEYITVKHETTTTGQFGWIFGGDARFCKLYGCVAIGAAGVASTTRGVKFTGGGTYSAFNVIDSCYFTGHWIGIDVQGTVTVLDVINTTFLGYTTSTDSCGLKCSNNSTYTIYGGHIEGFNTTNSRGIFSQGAYNRQLFIRYEANTVNWEWVRTAPNARIWGMAFGEARISGGNPIFPVNDVDSCNVIGNAGFDSIIDVGRMVTSRGFNERLRTENLGEWVTRTFSASNYQTTGGGTWTVSSGQVKADAYTRVGLSMVYEFTVEASTTTGGPTQLLIVIPATRAGQKKISTIIYVDEGGTKVACLATIDPAVNSGTSINIAKLSGAAFAATITGLYGQITFEIT